MARTAMDGERLDALAKDLASMTSRRGFIKAAIGVVGGGLLAWLGGAAPSPAAAQVSREQIERWRKDCQDNGGRGFVRNGQFICRRDDRDIRCSTATGNCTTYCYTGTECKCPADIEYDSCDSVYTSDCCTYKPQPNNEYPAPPDPRLDPVGGSGQFVDPALSGDGTLAPDDAPTAGTTTGWTVDVAAADERTLAPGTDVGNPAHDAEVIPPAREVWTARGRTIDDRTAAKPLRADGAGTIREVTTAREPASTRAPADAEPAVAAIQVDPEPVGNPDFDKFKGDCEGQGGHVEQTGEFQWTCYLPSGLTTTCDLTPSPDLYDCGAPQDSTLPGVGSSPSAIERPLLVSEPASATESGDEVSDQPVAVSDAGNQQVASGGGVIQLVAADEEEEDA